MHVSTDTKALRYHRGAMLTVAVRSVLLRTGAAALFALALAACGGGETPTATPTSPPPAPTATPQAVEPTPTPMPEAPSGAGWRTDIPVGDAIGNRASEVVLTLADGSVNTAESLAAGRSVLLYFFATW